AILNDNCPDLVYNFNNPGIDILIKKEKEHNTRKISYITKERLAAQEHNVVIIPVKEAKDKKQQKETRKAAK
ncbi:MAG: hypothetical protein ACTHJ0_10795, partial [Flavipsychrobacter sp.]